MLKYTTVFLENVLTRGQEEVYHLKPMTHSFLRLYPKAVITQKREKCNFHKDLHVLFIRAKYWNWAKCQIREQLCPFGIGA